MKERDAKGRFKRKELMASPPSRQHICVIPLPKDDSKEFRVLVIGCIILALLIGIVLGSVFGNNDHFVVINQSAQSYDQDQILTIEKELASKIIDYEIKYGTQDISWGVNVKFRE